MPLSPMMQHYLQVKEEYKDTLIFYRLGDFYELFFDDAKLVSKELELTLTGRDCGLPERAPMCGVPYHAVDSYISRLVEKGYRVAICEQVEDPKTAKGMVKREVVKVITAGTLTDNASLEADRNNYILCFYQSQSAFGIALADISTGKSMVTDVADEKDLLDEIYKFSPAEIICSESASLSGMLSDKLKNDVGFVVSVIPDSYYDDHSCRETLAKQFGNGEASSLGLTDFPLGYFAAGALFAYLFDTQKNLIEQILSITPYVSGDYMLIDTVTRRNLELTETLRDKNRRGSLLWVIDKTKTAMGARKLRSFLLQPLIKKEHIEARLDAVETFVGDPMRRDELREYLDSIYDLERLLARVANGNANPRDMIAFRNSLGVLPYIRQLLTDLSGKEIESIIKDLDPCTDIFELIDKSIDEDAPVSSHDAGIIKAGYDEQVDHYREAKSKGHQWLIDLEAREREKTGIKMLRIKYNRVFGYMIEVTNSFKDQVPEEYRRIQTLSNAERYTTTELKQLEDEITGAEEKLLSLEYTIFTEIRSAVAKEIARVQKTADAIALLDAYCSLAYVAMKNRYVRPQINKSGIIDIEEGRHPVIECMPGGEMFIPNDTKLDMSDDRILVITGPNMAGKSTYMRQTAVIALLAQMGSFVPASKANICVSDRIFTRVGASDDLASGQSTFMVEMTEVANILRNATKKSLIILDEIGRGTSTFDGLAIAWSVIEHIALKIKAKTLFATHYHELTELEGKLDGVKNYCIAVKEQGKDIVFLRKIVRGGADRSYGIQVARLAGVPEEVLKKASYLVKELVNADITEKVKDIADNSVSHKEEEYEQLSLFSDTTNQEIVNTLAAVDLESITPIEAHLLLFKLQNEIKGR